MIVSLYLLDDSELVGLLSKGSTKGGIESKTESGVESKSGEAVIRECFDYSYYTKNVDSIFKRVFGE